MLLRGNRNIKSSNVTANLGKFHIVNFFFLKLTSKYPRLGASRSHSYNKYLTSKDHINTKKFNYRQKTIASSKLYSFHSSIWIEPSLHNREFVLTNWNPKARKDQKQKKDFICLQSTSTVVNKYRLHFADNRMTKKSNYPLYKCYM